MPDEHPIVYHLELTSDEAMALSSLLDYVRDNYGQIMDINYIRIKDKLKKSVVGY